MRYHFYSIGYSKKGNCTIVLTQKGEKFEIETELNGHTPRSIVVLCEKDYSNKKAVIVKHAKYDDDNGAYNSSSVDVKVTVNKELCEAFRENNYMKFDTDKMIKEMF